MMTITRDKQVPLAEIRWRLIEALTKLPGDGDLMVWQRQLADAIIAAENDPEGYDVAELKRHRHLLRVIGDGLAHDLLPSHTIRTLSDHPGPRPASLAAQGPDLDFVFACANDLWIHGFVPILADLTTLIGIGDIVGWNAEEVVVIECKNRSVPKRLNTSGRIARQRQRGERAEEYLRTSQLAEGEGVVRVAWGFELPEPDWAGIERLLLDCQGSESGFSLLTLGPEDILIACAEHMQEPAVLRAVLRDASTLELPIMASYAELFTDGDHRARSPSSYPVTADLRWRLLERKLLLFRAVDMGKLGARFWHNGLEVRLTPEMVDDLLHLRLDVTDFESVWFNPPITEYCLLTPVSVSMREAFMAFSKQLVESVVPGEGLGSAMKAAEGDRFTYVTAYRNSGP
jgi:hypothetical protein